MKKWLSIILICFAGLFLYQSANKSSALKTVILEKYQLIGKVGNYYLYKDITVTIFPEALEKIYEDDKHVYYLPVISSNIYLLKNDKETIGLKEALQSGKITVKDLQKVINIYVEEKL